MRESIVNHQCFTCKRLHLTIEPSESGEPLNICCITGRKITFNDISLIGLTENRICEYWERYDD